MKEKKEESKNPTPKNKENDPPVPMPICPKCNRPMVHCNCSENELKK